MTHHYAFPDGYLRLEEVGFHLADVRRIAVLIDLASRQLADIDEAMAIRAGAQNIADQLAALRTEVENLMNEWLREGSQRMQAARHIGVAA